MQCLTMLIDGNCYAMIETNKISIGIRNSNLKSIPFGERHYIVRERIRQGKKEFVAGTNVGGLQATTCNRIFLTIVLKVVLEVDLDLRTAMKTTLGNCNFA